MIVRRHLPYELWYAVHLTAYAAIALAWFHQIPTGGDTPRSTRAPRATGASSSSARSRCSRSGSLSPLVNACRFRLRVAEVIAEGPTVTSLRMTGRRLDRLHARPGQFFLWRFLTGGFWWTAHPFSLSAAPDGRSLRISVKAAGDHTSRMRHDPGRNARRRRGPFGHFTDAVRRRGKVLLIAGGIGITPVRALAETMDGDLAVIHRVLADGDAVFRTSSPSSSPARHSTLHYVVGDHPPAEGQGLLSTAHLRELVPDLAERDVYLCGPPGMVACDAAEHPPGRRRPPPAPRRALRALSRPADYCGRPPRSRVDEARTTLVTVSRSMTSRVSPGVSSACSVLPAAIDRRAGPGRPRSTRTRVER